MWHHPNNKYPIHIMVNGQYNMYNVSLKLPSRDLRQFKRDDQIFEYYQLYLIFMSTQTQM